MYRFLIAKVTLKSLVKLFSRKVEPLSVLSFVKFSIDSVFIWFLANAPVWGEEQIISGFEFDSTLRRPRPGFVMSDKLPSVMLGETTLTDRQFRYFINFIYFVRSF